MFYNNYDYMSGIYCFENVLDGKRYVGQATDIQVRFYSHMSSLRYKTDSIYFQNAWDKYGEENFIFWIVELCPLDKLDALEILYIEKLNSHVSKNGYNISLGGNSGSKGIPRSKESKEKQSRAIKGRSWGNHTEETKQQMSESRKNMSDETRNKMSISKTGTFASDETREKLVRVHQGKKKNIFSSSKCVGVGWDKRENRWMARITIQKKGILIGYFEDEIEAALAVNECIMEYYGPTARFNQISQEEIENLWNLE